VKRAFFAVLLFTFAAHAQWSTIAPGVDYQHITRDNIDVHVTRIDMRHPNTIVVATDRTERGLTVSEFAKKTKAIAAINGDYFDPQLKPIGKSVGACGLWWKGSNVQRNQGLVGVGRGRAEIQRNTQKTKWWMRGAISGWPMLVQGCAVIRDLPGSDSFTRAPHPRTAVGKSGDGRMLYFVVADGRRPDVPGMTLPELAEFLASELGACEAMNVDGGGSSAMWVGDAIVNRPSDGAERKVGNHLAVVAAADYSGCPRKTER
jgi:exopolysaccharide biosynthesis protein